MTLEQIWHDRCEPYILPNEHGCWLWQRALRTGYGVINVAKKMYGVHRVAYQVFNGPIPEGLEIDHLCRVRRCCNPAHLQAVTRRLNQYRGNGWGGNFRKTHCPHGHPYDEENTYWHLQSPTCFRRNCRECIRQGNRKQYMKRKGIVVPAIKLAGHVR